jgi:HAD superfamily hydrolase (TIGR01450 family)
VINDDYDSPDVAMSEQEASVYKLDPTVVAVVTGINYTLSYRKIAIATMYILENKARFVGTNPDRNTGDERRLIPGGGTCIRAIEAATGVKAEIMGKPESRMYDLIRKEHHLGNEEKSKFLMVGDNLATDIKFGANCGISTLLVLTGCTSLGKAMQVVSGQFDPSDEAKPSFVQPFLGHSPSLSHFA